jgi:hypothetical protein
MAKKYSFPNDAQEIFDFMSSGPFFNGSYLGNIPESNRIYNVTTAVKNYTNQDIKPPFYFLDDITSNASVDIPSLDDEKPMRAMMKELDNVNYYDFIHDQISSLSKDIGINTNTAKILAGSIYENLVLCIESRLMSSESHPYFERLYQIYKDQAFPCGWTGSDSWKKGEFIICTRAMST